MQDLPLQTHCDVISAVDAQCGVIATSSLDVVRFWSVSSGMKVGEWSNAGGGSGGGKSGGRSICCIALHPVAALAAAPSSMMFAAGDVHCDFCIATILTNIVRDLKF